MEFCSIKWTIFKKIWNRRKMTSSLLDSLAVWRSAISLLQVPIFRHILKLWKLLNTFLAIPGHNANCKHISSVIHTQWSDERNKMKLSTEQNIVTVQFKFKHFSCSQFYRLKEKKTISCLKVLEILTSMVINIIVIFRVIFIFVVD